MKIDKIIALALIIFLPPVICSGIASQNGFDKGYVQGCKDGSNGQSEVITIDAKEKCIPREETIKLKK